MARRRAAQPYQVTIDSLSHEGRGVGRRDGKTVFVAGALPGETVMVRVLRRRRRYDEALATEIIEAAPERIDEPCAHARVCGGCSLQHLPPERQVEHKQAVLLELLEHQGGVTPETVLEPLKGPTLGYRRKARLGVKYVEKKGGALVGFREKGNPFIADIQHCAVLHPAVGEAIPALRTLISGLAARASLPQIEVAVSDDRVALVFRHLEALSSDDAMALARFGAAQGFDIWLQPGGPDSAYPLEEGTPALLSYRAGSCDIAFSPMDFTQVNADINRAMIERVLALLAPGPDDQVLDLFCGVGNFTLPLARSAGRVFGIEGEAALAERANANARANGLANVTCVMGDLNDPAAALPDDAGSFNKVLLDPPRTGAEALIGHFDFGAVQRTVYVSCNPATLARDAGLLCSGHGYRLAAAGIMDMFPHTAHVESIAVFDRG